MRLIPTLALAFCCAIVLSLSGNTCARGLDFITNKGQWPEQVRFSAALPGGVVFLTNTGFTYSFNSSRDLARIHAHLQDSNRLSLEASDETVHGHAYRVSLVGGRTDAASTPLRARSNYYNFFLGNDARKWAGGVPAFEEIDYRNVYEGVDLNIYSREAGMKYDFIVAPGARASSIRLAFEGVTPQLTASGDLLIRTSVNELREGAPFAYQVVDGRQQHVSCRYALKGKTVHFEFPEGYDRKRPLVIDPVLVFATYSGSTAETFGWSATYDTSGHLYAGGECFGTGWPVSSGAFQTSFRGNVDVSINKYSSSGGALLYSTYFGGSNDDYPNTMVVNHSGELVVAGATRSTDLPTTTGCFDNSFNGRTDVYVVHFNAAGTALLGSTYLGGSGREGDTATSYGHDANRGEVLTDSADNIYVAFGTSSADFPVTAGAAQTSLNGTLDAFVTKLNSSCSSILFSTFLGGSGADAAICMTFGPGGNIIVGGVTASHDFPQTSSGWQAANAGGVDGFIAFLNGSGSKVTRATYVGTTGADEVSKLQMDGVNNLYATGVCNGTFPVSPGVYSNSGGRNFILRLDTLFSSSTSTTIGTNYPLTPSAFMVDPCSNIYFVGFGSITTGLPLTSNAFQTAQGSFWLGVLNAGMDSLTFASYFGAMGDHIDGGSSRFDPSGIAYHSVCTNQSSLPTTPSVWSPNKLTGTANYDIGSWKFDFQPSGMKAAFSPGPDSVCGPLLVSFSNTSLGALQYSWDFGDGSAVNNLRDPGPHLYAPGTYTIRLYTYNLAACKPVDSAIHTIHVFDRDTVRLHPGPFTLCGSDSMIIPVKPTWNIQVTPGTGVRYQPNGGHEIVFNPTVTTSYVVYASSYGPCHQPGADTLRMTLVRDTTTLAHAPAFLDTLLCDRDTITYTLPRKPNLLLITPGTYSSVAANGMTIRFYPPSTTSYKMIALHWSRCDTTRDTLVFTIRRARIHADFVLEPKRADQHDPEFTLTNTSTGANTYAWYINDAFWTREVSPVLDPTDTGLYCFRLIAKNDYCIDTAEDCAELVETHIYVPSAFSPNGDGLNDLFRPFSHHIDVQEFSVYNRWGQRVFVNYDGKRGWDGRFNGQDCDLGTYFWYVKYKVLDHDTQIMKGDVTLVR